MKVSTDIWYIVQTGWYLFHTDVLYRPNDTNGYRLAALIKKIIEEARNHTKPHPTYNDHDDSSPPFLSLHPQHARRRLRRWKLPPAPAAAGPAEEGEAPRRSCSRRTRWWTTRRRTRWCRGATPPTRASSSGTTRSSPPACFPPTSSTATSPASSASSTPTCVRFALSPALLVIVDLSSLRGALRVDSRLGEFRLRWSLGCVGGQIDLG